MRPRRLIEHHGLPHVAPPGFAFAPLGEEAEGAAEVFGVEGEGEEE
jgi:hypothetical protein